MAETETPAGTRTTPQEMYDLLHWIGRCAKLRTAYGGFAYCIGEVVMERVQAITSAPLELEPTERGGNDMDFNEVVSDMSFDIGYEWASMPKQDRARIMDHVNGSRGLYDLVLREADAFIRAWGELDGDGARDYYEDVDARAMGLLARLKVESTK